jgi:tetraacyldisaccharide 4'-kinase
MKLFTPLLFPFAILYKVVTGVRNRLYDAGIKPSIKFDVPVISVGNLSVGGTGKTPMVEYLIRLLSAQYKVATLSRGYGRRSAGFRLASERDDALTLGDEPFQLYQKFSDRVTVAVGEDRMLAIPHIISAQPETNIILLDDAFQHRRVRPGFQVLITDYSNLFVRDFVLPLGRLRESRSGADRADVVVVSKCPPHISDDEMIAVESAIRKYSQKPVFFTRICYRDLLPATGSTPYKPEKVILLTAIANPKPLAQYVAGNYDLVQHFAFRDHHFFSPKNFQDVVRAAHHSQAAVITTQKDLGRIDIPFLQAASVPLYYLPIEIEFLKSGKEFDEMVLNAVRSYAT